VEFLGPVSAVSAGQQKNCLQFESISLHDKIRTLIKATGLEAKIPETMMIGTENSFVKDHGMETLGIRSQQSSL